MNQDKSGAEPLQDDQSAAIDPGDATKDAKEAMASPPRKPFGCLALSVTCIGMLLLLLAVFVYTNLIRQPQLKISPATTHITEPLTTEGTRVDYFAAFEEEFYASGVKPEANGYRLLVAALDDVAEDGQERSRSRQFYQKLGLDPEVEPTMSYIDPYKFLKQYASAEGLDEEQGWELYEQLSEPWTLDEFPMMEPWLKQNGPVLDLLAEAVRHPAFRFPMLRDSDDATLHKSQSFDEFQAARSFARMLQTRAYYRIGTGEIDGAIDDTISCARLGRHTASQGTAVAHLIGIALEGVAASVGIAAHQEVQPSTEQIQRLIDELDALPPRPTMARMLLAERYQTLDYLQSLAHGDESLAELLSHFEHGGFQSNIAVVKSPIDWNIVTQRVNEHFDVLATGQALQLPEIKSLSTPIIGERSRRFADLFASLYVPNTQPIAEAEHRLDCVKNLQRISLGMLLYEREHGTLPPAYSVDAAGQPLHSWRVLLLPYLGEQKLWSKLRLDEPWDSEHNRQFHDLRVSWYQCPSAELQPGQTTYSVVIGNDTAFHQGEGKSLDDFGMHLALVVEREQAVGWMDPMWELPQSVAFKGINRNDDGIGSPHPGGLNIGFRDGAATFIAETNELSTWQGLLDGTAEAVNW